MSTARLRFGIVGLGRVALNSMVPAIRRSSVASLYAAASRDRARAESLNPVQVYDDYFALLSDPEVDAVYIATHNGSHYRLAVEALRNGKHVLCEKPLGVTELECATMVQAAEISGRTLVEAFMYRYHPQMMMAKELVDAGRIGELRTVDAAFHFSMVNEDDVRLRSEFGGGALLDVGCYCVNAARYFLGDTPSSVDAVASFHPVRGVDTSVQAVLNYSSGQRGRISCGFEGGLYQNLALIGSGGTIRISEPFIDWAAESTLTLTVGRTQEVFGFGSPDRFQLELEDFSAAARGYSPSLLNPSEGVLNARILDRLAAAIRK